MGDAAETVRIGMDARRYVVAYAVGHGEPVTVYAHAWAASGAAMRPLSAGMPGTRVLVDFAGHGASPAVGNAWRYAQHTTDLAAVLKHFAARRVVGQSMGAGVILRLLRVAPGMVDRAALLLPPAPHRPPGETTRRLLTAVHQARSARDVDGLHRALRACLDERTRRVPGAGSYLRLYALGLLRSHAPVQEVDDHPWHGLGPGTIPAGPSIMVIGHDGDHVHPAVDARYVTQLSACANARVYPADEPLWRRLTEVRRQVATFLGDAA